MAEQRDPPAAAAAEGGDALIAVRDGREIRLTVTQIRHGLQPGSPALSALAAVTGVGAVRRIGADQFAAGALPLSLLAQDGAEPGAVLAWDGVQWAPAAGAGSALASGERLSPRAPRVVIERDAPVVVVSALYCGAVLRLTHDSEITVLLPAGLPDGCEIEVLQAGEGRARFVAAPGARLASRPGHARTAGQHARARVLLTAAGEGRAAVWTLSGDTAP
jgi:hypothetical protein